MLVHTNFTQYHSKKRRFFFLVKKKVLAFFRHASSIVKRSCEMKRKATNDLSVALAVETTLGCLRAEVAYIYIYIYIYISA